MVPLHFPYLGRRTGGRDQRRLSWAERIKQGLIKAAIVKRPQVIVNTVEAGVYYLYGYVSRPANIP